MGLKFIYAAIVLILSAAFILNIGGSEGVKIGSSRKSGFDVICTSSAHSLQPKNKIASVSRALEESIFSHGASIGRSLRLGDGTYPESNTVAQHERHSNSVNRANWLAFMRNYAQVGGFRRGFMRSRARNVESPALSVDTGGQSSNSIVGGISRLLKVEHGHYSDMYKRIDGRQPLTTIRPAEIIDESVKRVVNSLM